MIKSILLNIDARTERNFELVSPRAVMTDAVVRGAVADYLLSQIANVSVPLKPWGVIGLLGFC